jgi:hypothetical protein
MQLTVNAGAQFEILVDGVTRSWRDAAKTAFEAAQYLKERNPHSTVAVRDTRTGTVTPVMVVAHQQ